MRGKPAHERNLSIGEVGPATLALHADTTPSGSM